MTKYEGCSNMQIMMKNKLMAEKAKLREREKIMYDKAFVDSSEIMEVKGIGRKSAERLLANGIDTIEKLKELDEAKISEITGNPLTAKSLMNAVKAL